MSNKIDITSSVVEKGIDLAKEFLGKLIFPAIEETGLLLKDQVTYWKFKNQVKILNKAQKYCETNGISPQPVSLKLLCPLLDNAALEEDEILQDKWAILLSNMVDSNQNIQNHVFPYVLGQLSASEFLILEKVFDDNIIKVKSLTLELEQFLKEKPQIEKELNSEIERLKLTIEEKAIEAKELKVRFSDEIWELQKMKRGIESKLWTIKYQEIRIREKISAPESVPIESLRGYELSNIIRLGLVKHVQQTSANSQTLEIPNNVEQSYLTVDLDIELELNEDYILTELGELFIEACKEKKVSSLSKS